MASVTGLLSNNDLYQIKLARELDLYTRSSLDDDPSAFSDGAVNFDRLAASRGLRTTETLIDAIFNPVPTANEMPSPFTYYDPEKAREAEKASWAAERQSTHSSLDSGFTDDSSSHPASVYTTNSDSTGQTSDQPPRHWWQKMRNRPSTPLTRTFRPPTPQTTEISRIPT